MRIGIIGAGQLGQMLGVAARELGHECRFLDPGEAPPAATVGHVTRAAFDDVAAIAQLAADCDVLTYEFENVPVDALRKAAATVAVFPPPDALELAQDRLTEKRLFEKLEIPLPPYWVVDSRADLDKAARELGWPIVIKTRRLGYDGKGQFVARCDDDLAAAWDELGDKALIVESWVDFERELSIIGARSQAGDHISWPLTQNRHVDGILRSSLAPAPDSAGHKLVAETYMQRLLDELDYVGVLALELFVADGGLLANEFAPRVHNSGHWTIEGSTSSQFRNHILAICGATPECADCPQPAGMVNLIGSVPDAIKALNDTHIVVHDYGKAARAGRKLGHVTVVAPSEHERDQLVARVLQNVT